MRMFLKMVVVAVVAGVFTGCGSSSQPGAAIVPQAEVIGTAVVSKPAIKEGALEYQYAAYGATGIMANTFVVTMGPEEDGDLEFVIPEAYGNSYPEQVPVWVLRNLRVVDEDGTQVGPAAASLQERPAAPENSWKESTYVYLPVLKTSIPKGTSKTFRIACDAGWGGVETIIVALPDAGTGMFWEGISSHIVIRGVTSGKILKVKGEAIGDPIHFYSPYYPEKG